MRASLLIFMGALTAKAYDDWLSGCPVIFVFNTEKNGVQVF